MMGCAELTISKLMKPWDVVIELGDGLPKGSWMLVGGLMTQAHAMIAGYQSRATVDVDVLVDVMASTFNISAVVRQLEEMGFSLQEPGLRGTAFHRMTRGALIVDILVADHLPSGKARSAKVNRWPMMEIAGGAQAIERGMDVMLAHEDGTTRIRIPDLLGALVLKSAAYCADRRDRHRHLDDIALLASLVTDHKGCVERLHGSDRKRLRAAADALSDANDSSWMRLDPVGRKAGQFTLAVLTR